MNKSTAIVIALVAFIAGLTTYHFFIGADTAASPNTTTCPTDATFTAIWNTWSQEYLSENPGADGDDQVREWNMLMEGIGCPEWVNPFEDAIYGGTTTDSHNDTIR